MASRRRSVLKTPTTVSSGSASLCTSTSSKMLQSPSHQQCSGELPNIFTQMDEFTKKDSPVRHLDSSDGGNIASASCSPKRLRQSGTANSLSETLISNLHSVLSLPSSMRQFATALASNSATEKVSNDMCQSLPVLMDCGGSSSIVDDNKNCISRRNSCSSAEVTAEGDEVPLKKVKLLDACDTTEDSFESVTEQYCFDRLKDMRILTVASDELLTELFFLQNGGNLMDYFSWKKRPNTLLACYLCSERLESDPEMAKALQAIPLPADSDEETECVETGSTSVDNRASECTPITGFNQITSTPTAGSNWLKSSHTENVVTSSGRMTKPASPSTALFASPIGTSGSKVVKSTNSGNDQQGTPADGMHESIAELARQERKVMEKITELRKKGLWSVRRLPKAAEPGHVKAHWDYVIEEMQWLANDFAQERKWKKAGARKVARMVARHFQDLQQREVKAEREDALKVRRIASSIGKMVREFWTNIEKVVQYKQQSRLDEKRKKALDIHLSFIVDQTEKYSTWLTEGLTTAATVQPSSQPSECPSSTADVSSKPASPLPSVDEDDQDFEPVHDDSADDEETIEKDEEEHGDAGREEELAALQRESEMPLEELIKTLPPEVFDENVSSKELSSCLDQEKTASADKDVNDTDGSASDNEEDEDDDDGGSYDPSVDESSEDDEETLAEQERHEKRSADYEAEIAALQEEENLPIEELLKRYGGAFDGDSVTAESSVDVKQVEKKSDAKGAQVKIERDDEEEELGTEYLIKSREQNRAVKDEKDSVADEAEIGTEFLITNNANLSPKELSVPLRSTRRRSTITSNDRSTVSVDESSQGDESGPSRQITDIAADAMSLQPTGYTLETAHVKTSVPFLVKHPLREYQHVGLDWLATMYEHRLNGILADEMGLGKTIQTIALLAYLACDKSIWGPHLIVVPTSVMLNWEMELKKWCPAFKILTYYGSLKERKMKRQGWTKTNAFHVCITSYKLVIQDHQAFRRKKWKYFILDEAQNIKNFKSQRWQTLLNFHSQRRLLLTGTPLQNNLMELWSLMHFLMPHVFQSHREFKEWFSNPLTGMIEGSREYNEGIVRRLHKVLRPFLLRRLKQDVEKQMPKKYEHVVMCRLSKRQRFLYDDFMSQAKTKETLATGHYMSVINILMQLRKVCNHPDLFDPRPTISPFHMEGIVYEIASLALRALEPDPLNTIDLSGLQPSFCNLESSLSIYASKRFHSLAASRSLIVEMDGTLRSRRSFSSVSQQPELMKEVSTRFFNSEISVDSQLQEVGLDDVDQECGSLAMSCTSSYVNFGTLLDGDPGVDELADVTGGVGWDLDASPSASVDCDSLTVSLRCDSLINKRRLAQADKLEQLHHQNMRRCSWYPMYGSDCHAAADCLSYSSESPIESDWSKPSGYLHCLDIQTGKVRYSDYELFWRQTEALRNAVRTPEEHLVAMKDILDRFVFNTPPVTAPRITMHASHPSPSSLNLQRHTEFVLQHELIPPIRCLHSLTMSTAVQFPERRLIQYDCGKLQTLDVLLRQLKVGYHRVLVFTQMTKMLDVLEAFLNFHGHRYLRLDGTTKVEQRQALMERFNADQRIFVFILSTRSGGIGVNLTGADTVIFYDSDWNPTMDAQAQDRCHRIGQTRDVHIYRLISEKTIEENILKKANEKRLLGNVAIEGGNFTTAFFRQQTIKDLFEEPSGLESLTKPDSKVESKDDQQLKCETATSQANGETMNLNDDMIEQALTAAEDESDIQAAKVARAEASAELAEFDENIPWDEREMNAKRERDEESKVEVELAQLENELTPIERYAVSFVEQLQAPLTMDELQKAEEDVTLAKEEWEINHLKAIKEEEERQAEIEEDEMLYTNTHGSPRLKYLTSGSKSNKSKASSSKVKPVLSLYDYSAVDWESSVSSEDEMVPMSFKDEECIVDDELEISSVSVETSSIQPNTSLSFRGGRRKQYGANFVSPECGEEFDGTSSSKRKRGLTKKQLRQLQDEQDSDFEPPVKKKPGRKPKLVLTKLSAKMLKSRKAEDNISTAEPESDVEQEVETSNETFNMDTSLISDIGTPKTSQSHWFNSYRIPLVSDSTRTPCPPSMPSEVVPQQPKPRPVTSFVRLTSSGSFIVTSSPSTTVTGASAPSLRPLTPILEKFNAVVVNSSASSTPVQQVMPLRTAIPLGTRIALRGLRPRQVVAEVAGSSLVNNIQSANVSGNPTQIRYAFAAPCRPQQPSVSAPTAVFINNSAAGSLQQTANLIYQAQASMANVPRQIQLQVPGTVAATSTNAVIHQQQTSQNLYIVTQHSVSPVSQKQSFVFANSSVAAPPRVVTSDKSSFVLLPTSNRQNFILAPAASVGTPTAQVQQLSFSNAGLVLPSGITVRQQPVNSGGVRSASLLGQTGAPARQTTVVRAVAAPSAVMAANSLPILEKLALQLNAGQSTGARFELVTGTSPNKQFIPGGATVVQQGASPVKLIPGGASLAAVQHLTPGAPPQQFFTLSGGNNLRALGHNPGATGTIRLINRTPAVPSVASVVKPNQSFNLAQFIIRQPSAAVARPIHAASVGLPINSVQCRPSGVGTTESASPVNQLSTVIIVESRPPPQLSAAGDKNTK